MGSRASPPIVSGTEDFVRLPLSLAGRASLLGLATGLRSQLPLALLAVAANNDQFAQKPEGPLRLFHSRNALIGLSLSAIGELIGDKLPMTPSRLAAGPLGGRLAIGALAGAALAADRREPVPMAAALCAAGAGVGSYAGYHLRAGLGSATGIPDPVWAVAEDVVAISLGLLVVNMQTR